MAVILACAAVSLLICLPLWLHYKPLRPSLGVCFKALGTLCALIPALIAALKLEPACWVMVLALGLHVLADIVLEYQFVPGAGLFLLGHLCYASAFLTRFPLSAALPVCLVIFLGLLAWALYKNRKQAGKSLIPFAVYGAVLAFMASAGIAGGCASGTLRGVVTALGAALFVFSDGLIFRNLVRPELPRMDVLIMVTYYAAQLLLGASCLL